MNLIDQIKADREAGTRGPWAQSRYEFGRIVGPRSAVADCYGRFSGIWTNVVEANARRIARVPDMEAALIAAGLLLPNMNCKTVDNAETALAAFRKALEVK